MKIRVLLLFLITFSISLNAQKHKLSGTVIDDLNFYPLTNATVTIARTSDSLLIGFDRVSINGRFILDGLDTGRYDLYVSYPDYLGYIGDVIINTDKNDILLDTIFMIKNSRMLDEVTILDGSKIKFKGDTIQFIADSFKVGSNANVEDLLKKLSGLQVNSKGEITAFGEKVEKVFVDGEEFFGDDPTIATRSIQAKAIDKVQVFDKTSQMEELTGIADGEKFKAINLTLKEEYKKGYFGKVSAGVGKDPTYYDESLLLQAYSGKSKLSLYGILSNTGTTGLNFDDMNKYMGNQGNMSMSDDGGMNFFFSDEDDFDWDGRYNGQGLPSSLSLGTSFSTKLAKDKVRINVNYGYSDLKLKKESSVSRTNFLPENRFNSDENEVSSNDVVNNSAKVKLEFDIDSLTTLTINSSGSLKDINNFKDIRSENIGLDSTRLSQIERNLDSEGEKNSINSTFSLIRKFKKTKRLLALNGGYNFSEEAGVVLLKSFNQFYLEGKEQEQDQRLNRNITNSSLNTRLSYTEPLGDKWTTQVNYYYNINKNLSNKFTNEFDELTQDYTRSVDTLSNIFNYRVQTNGGGLIFAMKNEKYNFRFGTNAESSVYLRENKVDSMIFNDQAFIWLPSASFNYKFSRTSNFRFSYNGNTKQPSISQIQPIRDNSDPLNQVKGNPDLAQSYSQNFSVSYNIWKAISSMSIWTYANFGNTFNQIVSNNVIDISGRNISSFVNADGGYYGYTGLNFDKEITKLVSIGVGLDGNLNRSISFVNNQKSAVLSASISPDVRIELEKEDVFDFNIRYSPSFSNSSGGLVQESGNYITHHFASSFRYEITKSIKFSTEINYDIQPARSSFSEKFTQALWNADIEYKIGKGENFILKCAVNDILDQNRGYRRNVSSNFTEESTYNTIRRYVFLSLIYNIKSKV